MEREGTFLTQVPEPGRSQEPETQTWPPTWVAETQASQQPSSLPSPLPDVYYQEAESETDVGLVPRHSEVTCGCPQPWLTLLYRTTTCELKLNSRGFPGCWCVYVLALLTAINTNV